MLKKIATVLGSLAFIVSLSACNTVQGVGKDVQKAGSAVEQAGKK
jgi:entericidin B